MQKALVTGAAGFIGSHLCERLVANGWDVTGVDDGSTGSAENLRNVFSPQMRLLTGRADHVIATLQSQPFQQFDAIWHLAARIGVGSVIADPLRMLREHLTDGMAVLDAARQWNAKLVLTSTSEVYGAGAVCDEDAMLKIAPTHLARSGYAITKAYQEALAFAYQRAYGTDVLVLRLFNVAGPRQRAEGGCVIPIFAKAALQNQPLQMHDGSHVRRFMHVMDAVHVFTRLYETPAAWNQVVNVAASSGSTTVVQLAELVQSYCQRTYGSTSSIIDGAISATDAAVKLMAVRTPDTSRLDALIGKEIPRSLEQIVADVCDYWAARLNIEKQKENRL